MKHLAIKVTNKYESEAVQRALFDMGFKMEADESEFEAIFPRIQRYSDIPPMTIRRDYLSTIRDCCVLIPSSDFFATYAGHIERFPDYGAKAIIMDDPLTEDERINIGLENGSIIKVGEFYFSKESFYKGFMDFPDQSKPKFKVDDSLYDTSHGIINSYLIRKIADDSCNQIYYIAGNGRRIYERWIDLDSGGYIYSTPELAAKRFLELNSERL
jgi:hypothetical protein